MQNSPGITSITSPFSIDETLAKLKTFIASKGLTLFAHIDHSAGARDVGLTMQPAHVLIFGHAKAGTPLMVGEPSACLGLAAKSVGLGRSRAESLGEFQYGGVSGSAPFHPSRAG